MNDPKVSGFKPEAPIKSESNSMTVLVGVSNAAPSEQPGLLSCKSVSYTVGTVTNPMDSVDYDEVQPFAPGAVRTLKNRLKSRVSDSAFLRE